MTFEMRKKERNIIVHYDNIKGHATIDDRKKGVIIVLDREYIEALLEKVCFDCKWVIS
jgi:hypothetical protein